MEMVKLKLHPTSQPVNQKHKNDDPGRHQDAQSVIFRVIQERVVQIWLNSLDIQYYVISGELCWFELSKVDGASGSLVKYVIYSASSVVTGPS